MRQSWLWVTYVMSAVGCMSLHEVGHCIPAWASGYAAVPTLAKEYTLTAVPAPVQRAIDLGGVLGTVLASWGLLWLYFKWPGEKMSAALGGALLAPGFYVLRFLVLGRGHDGSEFQEAQAALGLSFSGHSLDWFFLASWIAIAALWLVRSRTRPGLPLLWKFVKGGVLGLLLVVVLQRANNAFFDPIFEHRQPPPTKDTRR